MSLCVYSNHRQAILIRTISGKFERSKQSRKLQFYFAIYQNSIIHILYILYIYVRTCYSLRTTRTCCSNTRATDCKSVATTPSRKALRSKSSTHRIATKQPIISNCLATKPAICTKRKEMMKHQLHKYTKIYKLSMLPYKSA